MAWTTPKTDWTDNGSYFNLADWNRMRDNLRWLEQNKGDILSDVAGIEVPALSLNQLPSASELNVMIDATQALIDFWISPAKTIPMRRLQNDEMSWTAADLNAIEKNHKTLHDEISTLKTWNGIAAYVRNGIASKAWKVGSVLKVNHSVYGWQAFRVMGHDIYKPVSSSVKHTMTLMSENVLSVSAQFSRRDAFYYAESALAAGTYHFRIKADCNKWQAGTYQFTLTKSVPAGGQLRFLYSNSSIFSGGNRVESYSSPTSFTVIEQVRASLGNAGTDLGDMGEELNDAYRSSDGSNNYKESSIRMFLNSNAAANSVWTAPTHYSVKPDWLNGVAGYIRGLPSDLQNVLCACKIPCVANASYEAPDSTTLKRNKYVLQDKVTIPSHMEMFGDNPDLPDGSKPFAYYVDATDEARRKRSTDGTLRTYYLRTPVRDNAGAVNRVSTTGVSSYNAANTTNPSIVPIINIG